MNYFVITKKEKTASGLWDLNLDAYVNNKKIGSLVINSGIASRQNFRTFKDQVKGELEPIPEGEFDLGPLCWAGGKNDYSTNYREIQSPIWVVVVRSRAIGFHLDGNRDYAPGSAGCPVFKNMADLKTFVSWYEEYGTFLKCFVDWGLNYVKLPKIERDIKNVKRSEPHVPDINIKLAGKKLTGKVIEGISYIKVRDMAETLQLSLRYDKDSHCAVIGEN